MLMWIGRFIECTIPVLLDKIFLKNKRINWRPRMHGKTFLFSFLTLTNLKLWIKKELSKYWKINFYGKWDLVNSLQFWENLKGNDLKKVQTNILYSWYSTKWKGRRSIPFNITIVCDIDVGDDSWYQGFIKNHHQHQSPPHWRIL